MKKIILFTLSFSLFSISYSQCLQWDDTTMYEVGDKVIYTNKAYEALVSIWHWPPPHPLYWKQISMSGCNVSDSIYCFNLLIKNTNSSKDTGITVILDSFPDGSVGPIKDTTIYYDNKTSVNLTARIDSGYIFLHWHIIYPDTSYNNYDTTLDIDINNIVLIDAIYRKLGIGNIRIDLIENGKVKIDTLPNGIVDTFDTSDGRSISFDYLEGNKIILTALPDSGYELIDWGDEYFTSVNPLNVNINYDNYYYFPTYDLMSSSFKFPFSCNVNDHMRVTARSRYYGYSEILDGLMEKGKVFVRDKFTTKSCEITHDNITLGNTFICSNKLKTNKIKAGRLIANTMMVPYVMKSDSIITNHLIVDVNSFPDYVFDKDYPLMSIEEVKSYIDKFGHLPGIPSEEEVKKNNLDLVTMYPKLLEKVEEMVLYIIDLNNELKELEKEDTCVK